MVTVLEHKSVLHIPRQYWDGAQLIDLDLREALSALTADLCAAGLPNAYEVEAYGRFCGRRYPELQMVLFTGEDTFPRAEQVFRQWVQRYHSVLRQEVYAWEADGKLYLLPSSNFSAGQVPEKA